MRKEPVRRKGRAERIIESLTEYGLMLSGVAITVDGEELVQIDNANPYKNTETFSKSDFYRVYESDGRPVIEKRRLSGILKWIEGGGIEDHETYAQKYSADIELKRLLSRIQGRA